MHAYNYLKHEGKMSHFFTSNLSNGGIEHLISQPLKHWSYINIGDMPINYPHNMQCNPIITIAKDRSIGHFLKIIRFEITSKVVGVVCCKYT
jgi:hypothetical protein